MILLLLLLLLTILLLMISSSYCYVFKPSNNLGYKNHHKQLYNLYGKKNKKDTDSIQSNIIINIDDYYQDNWKLDEIIKILNKGGLGVIPTDSCYSFCTKVSSREGIQRLIKAKGMNAKKPLSILCKDISTIAKYTSNLSEEQWVYKLFKGTLPGPFTYILPASKELPKIILESRSKKHMKQWRRKEIGCRMPNDDICMHILQSLDEPLIVGSVPEAAEDILGLILTKKNDNNDNNDYDSSELFDEDEDDDSILKYDDDHLFENITFDTLQDTLWLNSIDFFVQNGPRPVNKVSAESLTTVIDLTSGHPEILRQGMGIVKLQ